ncbi:ABC transporter ATP-binding protein [Jiella sp. MQZ9-1]|uniref:ABC transporter ATP-binding protein n=1 Tax=Jiella flava TaxID=2816857 RepID=A0A939JVW2_9HYPH|nr:ABC transporter ATP-binding protein [Jiella flava]MBO0662884.1 ABC transporter ATP-binding protein [Jiella flava]MCD2471356.1 ABC transporter ATP-binding protein [Jiella flava]
MAADIDLELVQLRKVYPGGTVAVEGFDLRVKRGEFISFVGPSGCGKTTTLRMIAGLESISSGDLLIRNRNFTDVPAEKRPTATIFQNYAIFPHMTVWENVAFGLRVRKLPSAEIKRRVDAIIDKLELGSVAGAKEGALAGGQKQRLALARGLVTEPDILLLDEPLGALDANLRKSIQEELKLLQRNLGLTFVFVTHAQSEALSMGDRVVVMNAGKVEQISAPFELYTRPQSPFVARFIGRNNIIDGTLAEAAADRAVIATRFGPLSGLPTFDRGKTVTGHAAYAVVPSEYVGIEAVGGAERQDMAGVDGTCTALDPVGQVVYVSVRLDDALEVRLETHREMLSGRGIAPGTPVHLSWRPDRVTIVADAA